MKKENIRCLRDGYIYYKEQWEKAGKPKGVMTPKQLEEYNHKHFGNLIGHSRDWETINQELEKLNSLS